MKRFSISVLGFFLLKAAYASDESNYQRDFKLGMDSNAQDWASDAFHRGSDLQPSLTTEVKKVITECVFRDSSKPLGPRAGTNGQLGTLTIRAECQDRVKVKTHKKEDVTGTFESGYLRFDNRTLKFLSLGGYNPDRDEIALNFYDEAGAKIAGYGIVDYTELNSLTLLNDLFKR